MKYFFSASLCILLLLAVTACKQSEPASRSSLASPQPVDAAADPALVNKPIATPSDDSAAREVKAIDYKDFPDGELFSEQAFNNAVVTGAGKDNVTIRYVDVTDLPGVTKAIRIETSGKSKPGTAQRVDFAKDLGRIQEGYDYDLTFYVKGISSTDGTTPYITVTAGETDNKSGRPKRTVQAQEVIIIQNDVWQKWEMDFVSTKSSDDKGTLVGLQVGYDIQTLEVAGFGLKRSHVEEYVNTNAPLVSPGDIDPNLGSLNGTITAEAISQGSKYDFSQGEQWRIDAEQRIEKYKKGDVSITVVDSNGNPIPDAQIKLEMTNQNFLMGGGINENSLNEKQKKQILDAFNTVVFTGSLKWKADKSNKNKTVDLMDWLVANNKRIRGHTLVWPKWNNIPDDITAKYKSNPAGLDQEFRDRINKWVPFYGNRITEWDVTNELRGTDDIMGKVGWDKVDTYLRMMKELEPGVKADMNEAGLLQTNLYYGAVPPRETRAWFMKFFQGLVDQGSPLDGIGIQFYLQYKPHLQEFIDSLAEIGSLGVPTRITEFGFQFPNDDRQAELYVDLLTAAYADEHCQGMLSWWPWGGAGTGGIDFTNTGYFSYRNQELKPMGEAMFYLLYYKWWTNEHGTTNAEGVYNTRAFFGDHEITVTANGKTKTIPVSILENEDFKVTM